MSSGGVCRMIDVMWISFFIHGVAIASRAVLCERKKEKKESLFYYAVSYLHLCDNFSLQFLWGLSFLLI